MSDTTYNRHQIWGTDAQRIAFTPDPGDQSVVGPGVSNGVIWVVSDVANNPTYAWDFGGSAWVQLNAAGSGTVTNTGTLTDHALIVGNGGVDVSALGSLGTTTTLLHGNAAGDPTFSAVVTADITDANVTLAKIANAANNSRILGSGSGGSGAAYTELTAGAGVSIGASSVALSTAALTRAITFAIDGGGSALTTGIKADISVPYACTITSVVMLADQSGSVVVDIWKDTLANYPPTGADSITASAKPTITTATNSTDTTLTGWTTSISAGDTLRFNVDSATTITRLSLTLKVTVS